MPAVDSVLDAFSHEREIGETGGRFGLADELVAFFLVFYLEFHAEHVVVLSEPWLARPECANGVQVPVDALFPPVICFDAVRPHRETRRPLKERALVDYGCASPTRKTALPVELERTT